MMKDVGITFKELVNMSNNPIFHFKTKHIAIKYHVLREKVAQKEIRLEYINTKEQIVEIFTKTLLKDTFEYLRGMLRVMPLPSLEQMMQKCINLGQKAPLLDQTEC